MLNHVAVGTACARGRLKEVLEHFGEETFERGEPVEHTDALGGSVFDALCVVEVCRQFIEQVVLPCREITLIEVIADDERLKRHTLKLCVDCAMRANFSESDGQCRHAVEPVEHMGGSFHLIGSENKLLLAVPTSPAVIAVAVQDFLPCPAAEAIGFDFGRGVALREQGENEPKLLFR